MVNDPERIQHDREGSCDSLFGGTPPPGGEALESEQLDTRRHSNCSTLNVPTNPPTPGRFTMFDNIDYDSKDSEDQSFSDLAQEIEDQIRATSPLAEDKVGSNASELKNLADPLSPAGSGSSVTAKGELDLTVESGDRRSSPVPSVALSPAKDSHTLHTLQHSHTQQQPVPTRPALIPLSTMARLVGYEDSDDESDQQQPPVLNTKETSQTAIQLDTAKTSNLQPRPLPKLAPKPSTPVVTSPHPYSDGGAQQRTEESTDPQSTSGLSYPAQSQGSIKSSSVAGNAPRLMTPSHAQSTSSQPISKKRPRAPSPTQNVAPESKRLKPAGARPKGPFIDSDDDEAPEKSPPEQPPSENPPLKQLPSEQPQPRQRKTINMNKMRAWVKNKHANVATNTPPQDKNGRGTQGSGSSTLSMGGDGVIPKSLGNFMLGTKKTPEPGDVSIGLEVPQRRASRISNSPIPPSPGVNTAKERSPGVSDLRAASISVSDLKASMESRKQAINAQLKSTFHNESPTNKVDDKKRKADDDLSQVHQGKRTTKAGGVKTDVQAVATPSKTQKKPTKPPVKSVQVHQLAVLVALAELTQTREPVKMPSKPKSKSKPMEPMIAQSKPTFKAPAPTITSLSSSEKKPASPVIKPGEHFSPPAKPEEGAIHGVPVSKSPTPTINPPAPEMRQGDHGVFVKPSSKPEETTKPQGVTKLHSVPNPFASKIISPAPATKHEGTVEPKQGYAGKPSPKPKEVIKPRGVTSPFASETKSPAPVIKQVEAVKPSPKPEEVINPSTSKKTSVVPVIEPGEPIKPSLKPVQPAIPDKEMEAATPAELPAKLTETAKPVHLPVKSTTSVKPADAVNTDKTTMDGPATRHFHDPSARVLSSGLFRPSDAQEKTMEAAVKPQATESVESETAEVAKPKVLEPGAVEPNTVEAVKSKATEVVELSKTVEPAKPPMIELVNHKPVEPVKEIVQPPDTTHQNQTPDKGYFNTAQVTQKQQNTLEPEKASKDVSMVDAKYHSEPESHDSESESAKDGPIAKDSYHVDGKRAVLLKTVVPPTNGTYGVPLSFEYLIFQKVYSEFDDPSSISARQIAPQSQFVDIDAANQCAENLVQAMHEFLDLSSAQFEKKEWSRDGHDCVNFTGIITEDDNDNKGLRYHKVWVERRMLTGDSNGPPTPKKSTSIRKTLYTLRLCKIIHLDEDEDQEPPASDILQYVPITTPEMRQLGIFREFFTDLSRANREARELQVALSHKKGELKDVDKTWQQNENRKLWDKLYELEELLVVDHHSDDEDLEQSEESKARKNGCWETKFNGLDGERYKLWVDRVTVYGPRNI